MLRRSVCLLGGRGWRFHSSPLPCRTSSTNEFKSIYSLDKLYPNSSGDFNVPYSPHSSQVSSDDFTGHIPVDKLTIKYSRSSGPGGQNVNKVNSKVDVRFNVQTAEWIPEGTRTKMLEKFKTKINAKGELIITSDTTRAQIKNLSECLQKLRDMISEADRKPTPISAEDKAAFRMRVERFHRERLRQKKNHSIKKEGRSVYVE
ncbi:large ribosomal subunit protein mL62-like [Glandiceps talaboti]